MSHRRTWCLILVIGLVGTSVVGADEPAPAVELTEPVPIEAGDDRSSLEDAPRMAAAAETGLEHPLAPAIRIAQSSLTRMKAIQDYEATLIIRERTNDKVVEQTMHLKLRERPLSVYLKYGEPFAGREVLFVKGQDGDKLWSHNGEGLAAQVGTVSLEADHAQTLNDSRYPITSIGMQQKLQTVIGQWKQESLYAECDVQIYPDARLRGRNCEVIESSHPRPRRQFRFQRTRIYIDAETRLPVRFEQFGFSDTPGAEAQIEELYEYANLRTNVGLTDEDFDRKNPSYSF